MNGPLRIKGNAEMYLPHQCGKSRVVILPDSGSSPREDKSSFYKEERPMQSWWRAMLAIAALALISTLCPAQAFGPPVKVTPFGGFGYEPSFVADHYGNIFATAHKENWQLVLAPDTNSPTYTRSMSWDWISTNGGQTW